MSDIYIRGANQGSTASCLSHLAHNSQTVLSRVPKLHDSGLMNTLRYHALKAGRRCKLSVVFKLDLHVFSVRFAPFATNLTNVLSAFYFAY